MTRRVISLKPFILRNAALAVCAAALVRGAAWAGATHETRPEIFLNFSTSEAPVDLSRVRMTVDGEDVTGQAVADQFGVRFTPGSDLSEGRHAVEVFVADVEGRSAVKRWTFDVKPGDGGGDWTLQWDGDVPENGTAIPKGRSIALTAQAEGVGEEALRKADVALRVRAPGSAGTTAVPREDLSIEGSAIRWNSPAMDLEGAFYGELKVGLETGAVKVLRFAFLVSDDRESGGAEDPSGSLNFLRPRGKNIRLDPLDDPSPNPAVEVKGQGPADAIVALSVNGVEAGEETADAAGRFSFPVVYLEEGENELTLTARSAGGEILGQRSFPDAVLYLPEGELPESRFIPPTLVSHWPGESRHGLPDGFEVGAVVNGISGGLLSGGWAAEFRLDGKPLPTDVLSEEMAVGRVSPEMAEPGAHEVSLHLTAPNGDDVPLVWGIYIAAPGER